MTAPPACTMCKHSKDLHNPEDGCLSGAFDEGPVCECMAYQAAPPLVSGPSSYGDEIVMTVGELRAIADERDTLRRDLEAASADFEALERWRQDTALRLEMCGEHVARLQVRARLWKRLAKEYAEELGPMMLSRLRERTSSRRRGQILLVGATRLGRTY